jgi:hypothetical protein
MKELDGKHVRVVDRVKILGILKHIFSLVLGTKKIYIFSTGNTV